MADEKGNVRREVPEVTMNILATASEVKKDLLTNFPAGGDDAKEQSLDSNESLILKVSWKDCGLSQFAEIICKADLKRVPIKLDRKQTEKLWSYLAFYWRAFLYNNKEFYNKEHKTPDFAIVSALFRETEWGAIGLMDKRGIETRELLAQAMNLLYYTRYADVVHAHFIVELQMIFATLRKQEEGPDDPPRLVLDSEKNKIKNNWLTFCNFLSLVSDIDEVQPDLTTSPINVLGDLRLMVQSLMKYVSFGLQYVYTNVKKMPQGINLCKYSNYYDPAYGHERDFDSKEFSRHKVPIKPYLLTQSDFEIIPSDDGITENDIAAGLRQFAQIFVNPYFQALLTYFKQHCMQSYFKKHHVQSSSCEFFSGPVKSVDRMVQKAHELKSNTLNLEDALLSLHDICRASFCVQLPKQILLIADFLRNQNGTYWQALQNLEVIRIRNLFNEDEQDLKSQGKKKNLNIWSEEGITHYRNLKIDVRIVLPSRVTYIDPKGNRFIGSEFIGEIELLMDSYRYAKRQTHKYWKLQRIRKSKDLLNLPLWEHPADEETRKSQKDEEDKKLMELAGMFRPNGGEKECWRLIKNDGKKYINNLNASCKNQGNKHEIRFDDYGI